MLKLYVCLGKMVAYCCIYLLNKFFLLLNYQMLSEIVKQPENLHLFVLLLLMELLSTPLLMFGLRPRNQQSTKYMIMCICGILVFMVFSIEQYNIILYNKSMLELVMLGFTCLYLETMTLLCVMGYTIC